MAQAVFRWREDRWYVLCVARVLDVTPQQVLDMEWPDIAQALGEEGSYHVALGMRYQGNPDFWERRHINDLRKRGKL